MELVDSGVIRPGCALEVGCGTGSDALWLAAHGFAVVGLDMSPLAVERADARRHAANVTAQFVTLDFLAADVSGGPFAVPTDHHSFDVDDEDTLVGRVVAAKGSCGERCIVGTGFIDSGCDPFAYATTNSSSDSNRTELAA